MDFKVYVFDSEEEGKRGAPTPINVQVSAPAPVKVVDVLLAVLAAPKLAFPFEATTVFALWCTSPLLELQLKPDQKVNSVLDRWQELLAKYTTATTAEAKYDVPVLMLRRNCFYPKSQERKLLEQNYLRLLCNEAQFNVKTYRYVPSPDRLGDYFDMAGAKVCIDRGLFDSQRHTVELMKGMAPQYFTEQFLKPSLAEQISGGDRVGKITKNWVLAYEHCSGLNLSMVQLYRRYLQVCWNMPTYCAVFFKGTIAPPSRARRTLLDREDLPIRVAINPEGVHIILENRNEYLVSFAFEQISWDYEKAEREGEHEFASLYLQFDGELADGTKCKHVVEIFSRQAQLMDAMIEQCVDMVEEDEDRVAEARRCQGKSGRCEIIEPIRTGHKRSVDDAKFIAKKVFLQTCIGGENFDGVPKPHQAAVALAMQQPEQVQRATRV